MAMIERLLLQVFERKKSNVDQVKHQALLFDQHLASTLLIEGIDPPDWLLRSQPSAAEYKEDEIMLKLFQGPSQFSIPNSSCCRSVHEKALVNNKQHRVDSSDNLGSVIDTCDRHGKLSVLPEDTADCVLVVQDGLHSTEFNALSPNIQNTAGTCKSHHDLELSLASLQRSKTRQRALELRNSAKASQSHSRTEINENSEGNRVATSGIGKCYAGERLDHAGDGVEAPAIAFERIPICKMPCEKIIYADEPEIRSLFRNSGVDMPPTKSLAGSYCTLGEVGNIHWEANVVVKENVGLADIMDVKGTDCSEKVLRSQSSTCSTDLDNVIKLDGCLSGEHGLTSDEHMPQSISVDHLQEADEKCGLDQNENELCQEIQHESAYGSFMESRSFSDVSDSNKIVDMDNSSNIGELLVEGSGGLASKNSESLVCLGCQSVEARSVTFSQHVSARAGNRQNVHGCDTDVERYVEDSARGSLPSRSPAEAVSLGKSEMDAFDLSEKDMEVLVPSCTSYRNMLLEPKQLKFASLGESIGWLNIDSTMISEKTTHRGSPLRQTSIIHRAHKNEEKFGEFYSEDHLNGTIQLGTIPRLIVESSRPSESEEQCSNPASDGGESLELVIGNLSSNIVDDRRKAGLGEQEQNCAEELKQANYLCSEEGHGEDIEPVLQVSNVIGSSSSQFSDFFVVDQHNPVLEGFVITTDDDQPCISEKGFSFKTQVAENATMQNGRILELLGKPSSLNTPLQHLSIGNTDDQISRLYQTVPNGLPEHMDLTCSLALNDGKQADHAVDGRPYTSCFPYCEAASTRNNRKPYASPVGKLWESVHTNSGSSKHKSSSLPELPCISEEIEFADEAVDRFDEVVFVKMASAKRKPLAQISEDPSIPMSNDGNELAGRSPNSTIIETTFLTTNERLSEKHKNQESRKRDFARKIKSSKAFERGPNGVKRAVKSPRNKLTHPKTCPDDGGSGISRKKSTLDNIVSGMTSFLPFVQQNQAAAPCTGKRNVKVKALEAAEAAKRQAEKKEIERKMKKEALKLERERVEKEKMVRLELEKKRKDEERRKKEAEMTLKKRLREEEDKREKEKKRRHIKEPRKNTVDRRETSCAGRQLSETKDLNRVAGLTEEKEFSVHSEKQVVDNEDGKVGRLDGLSQTTSGLLGRERLTMEHDLSEDDDNLELSYDISPYKCSDDEDEEEDDMPNHKFIPSWARKGSVAQDVFSQQNLDPTVIFPPDSFCSISEGRKIPAAHVDCSSITVKSPVLGGR